MFSNLLFVIEILIAEFLLTFRLKRRKYYILRFLIMVLVLTAAAIFVPTIDSAWYTCFIYLLLFALTIIGLKILNDEPWINVLFCAIAAYTMQHFAYQFTNIIFTLIIQGESPLLGIYHTVMLDFTKLDANAIFWAAVYVMCYFSVYGVIWFLFGRKINKNESFKIKNQALVVIIGLVLILNVLLNAIFVYLKESLSFVILIIWHISGVFNCFLLLQWQFELVQNKQLQTELDFTKKLLLQAKEQFKISKENIDLINLKCHDMKHQIREIGLNKSLDDETVRDLEQTISVYESMVKTDNEALDVILTEKSLKCLRHNIILNCIADGKIIQFMKSSDVYSLFGNALDNAIEAVMKITDKAKRIIGLKVYSVGDFVTIGIKNFYQGNIQINKDGLPKTTKDDTLYHGFGIKSIRMIVDKYDGDLSVLTKDNIFFLNILIPITHKQKV